MAKMTIDGVGTTNEPIGPLRYTVQPGRSARDRTREKLLRRLHQDFPLTEVRVRAHVADFVVFMFVFGDGYASRQEGSMSALSILVDVACLLACLPACLV